MTVRVRKPIEAGWTELSDDALAQLKVSTLLLAAGDSFAFDTADREYALVLVRGDCRIQVDTGLSGRMGPRENPFEHAPHGAMLGRGQRVQLQAEAETLIAIGSAPAAEALPSSLIRPEDTGGGSRGADNWRRDVRFVCWSDNSAGNLLMAGETCTPSGNWSTIPPHRHELDRPGEEVPYEEAYFFQFSRPEGFGLLRKFDQGYERDEAFTIRHGDVFCIAGDYHPLVCGPGATLYHVTFMAGPYRTSQSSVHPDFTRLLDEKGLTNPFRDQRAQPGGPA